MKECVLVTGGAGFIGGVVTSQLLERGYEVVVLDDLSNSCKASVAAGAKFEQGSIADRTLLDRVFRENKIGAVMHFAAFIEAGESMKFPEKYFRNNTVNALTLLEALLEHGVQRFVFSSTAALYGTPERTPIEETDKLQPTNAYGESKLLVERMLDWMNRIHKLRYACLRYFNAAGAAGERGRGSSSGITSDSADPASGAWTTGKYCDLWNRLPNSGWNVRARLRAHQRSGQRTPAGIGSAERKKKVGL